MWYVRPSSCPLKLEIKTFRWHLNHRFNFEIILHKHFVGDSVQKLFRLSYPLFSICASGVERGSTVTFWPIFRWAIQRALLFKFSFEVFLKITIYWCSFLYCMKPHTSILFLFIKLSIKIDFLNPLMNNDWFWILTCKWWFFILLPMNKCNTIKVDLWVLKVAKLHNTPCDLW